MVWASAGSISSDDLFLKPCLPGVSFAIQARWPDSIQPQAPEKGVGVLFSSHDFELLKAICHEVLRLGNGILVPRGLSDSISHDTFSLKSA